MSLETRTGVPVAIRLPPKVHTTFVHGHSGLAGKARRVALFASVLLDASIERLNFTDATVVRRDHTDASRPPTHPNCTPPQRRNLLVLAELLSLSTHLPQALQPQTATTAMPQTRSQTKADKVDQRVDAVAYYLAVAVPVIFLYTVAQNLGYA